MCSVKSLENHIANDHANEMPKYLVRRVNFKFEKCINV